ncbi:MAG: type I restriction enzyme HsdR N-terminal domain-containing protein [Candidatus Cloacimonetes bacterium]|nr:type I restriction enzyme HsdR N-terminal domain-containing protein [Candidatus Cloacimonadota bacterium]
MNERKIMLNEEEVKNKIIIPWLKDLGFDEHNLNFETTLEFHAGRGIFKKLGKKNIPVKKEIIKPRLDILVKDKKENGKNLFVIEVKAENRKINNKDINQAFSYARLIHPMAPLFMVSNGTKKGTKLFKTSTKEEITSFSKNFANQDDNFKIEPNIENYHEALRYFIGYSENNLSQFCKNEYDLNVKNLKAIKKEDNKSYLAEVYEPSQKLASIFDNFLKSEKKTFALVGNSGMGKTCWICNTTENYISKKYPVLFYQFKDIENGIFETIVNDLNWSDDISPILSPQEGMKRFFKIFKDKEVLFFLDGLDEKNSAEGNRILEKFFKYSHNKNIKLIVTCKGFYWDKFLLDGKNPTRLSDELFTIKGEEDKKGFLLNELEKEQFQKLLDKYRKVYKYNGLIEPKLLQEFQRNPYLLRITFEYASQKNMKSLNFTVKRLFLLYYEKLLKPLGNDDYKKNILNQIAKIFYDENQDSINVDKILQKIKQEIPDELFRWNILTRRTNNESETFIEFYFSKLRDFIIAFKVLKFDLQNNEYFDNLKIRNKINVQLEVINSYYLIAEKKYKRMLDQKAYNKASNFLNYREKIIDEHFSTFKKASNPFTNKKVGIYCDVDFSNDKIKSYAFREIDEEEDKVLLNPSPSHKDFSFLAKNYNFSSMHYICDLEKKTIWKDIEEELFDIIEQLQAQHFDRRFDLSMNKYALQERILSLITKSYKDYFKINDIRPCSEYLPIRFKDIKKAVYEKIIAEKLMNEYLKINKDNHPLGLSFWDFRKAIKEGTIYQIFNDIGIDLKSEIQKISKDHNLLKEYLKNINDEDSTILEDISHLENMGISKIDKPVFPDWNMKNYRRKFSFNFWNKSELKHNIEILYKIFLDEYKIFIKHNFPSICKDFIFYSSLPLKVQIIIDFDKLDNSNATVITFKITENDNFVEVINTKLKPREDNNSPYSYEKVKENINFKNYNIYGALIGFLNSYENNNLSSNIPWYMDILQRFLYGHLEEDLKKYFHKIEMDRIKSFRFNDEVLNELDIKIFNNICKIAIKKDKLFIGFKEITEYFKNLKISKEEISKSMNRLEENIFLTEVTKNILGDIVRLHINPYALDFYAKLYFKDYNKLQKDIIKYLLDNYKKNKRLTSDDIIKELSTQLVIVNLILGKLEDKNLIKKHTSILNRYTSIYFVSDELKKERN